MQSEAFVDGYRDGFSGNPRPPTLNGPLAFDYACGYVTGNCRKKAFAVPVNGSMIEAVNTMLHKWAESEFHKTKKSDEPTTDN
jgi:hypothetical protein